MEEFLLIQFLDDLFAGVQQTASLIQKGFTDPDSDWVAATMILSENGKSTAVFPQSSFFSSEETKDQLGFEVLPQMIRERRGVATVSLWSTWTIDWLDASDDDDEAEKAWDRYKAWRAEHENSSLGDYDEAVEALYVYATTADGVVRIASAKIIRDGVNPPTLDEWKERPADGSHQGRMVGPMIAAMKDVRDMSRDDAA